MKCLRICNLPLGALIIIHMWYIQVQFLPGEMKKVLHSFLSRVTSLISLVMLTSRPATGGTLRKSRILKRDVDKYVFFFKQKTDICKDGVYSIQLKCSLDKIPSFWLYFLHAAYSLYAVVFLLLLLPPPASSHSANRLYCDVRDF